MIPLRDCFPDRLQNPLKLFDGRDYSALDKLELGRNHRAQLLVCVGKFIDGANGLSGVGVLPNQIKFSRNRGEQGGIVVGKSYTMSKELCYMRAQNKEDMKVSSGRNIDRVNEDTH